MDISELWTVSTDEIRDFIRSLPKTEERSSGTFVYSDCTIRLREAEDHYIGNMRLPRTRVELSGNEEDVKEFYKYFVLRFMSAGG